MTTAPARKNKKTYTLAEENHFEVVRENLDELDIDLFLAISDEEEKPNPDQVKLKKLKALRAELKEVLKKPTIEYIDILEKADEKIFKALQQLK